MSDSFEDDLYEDDLYEDDLYDDLDLELEEIQNLNKPKKWDIIQDYQKWYKKQYPIEFGIPEGAPERVRLFKEAELRRLGEKEVRRRVKEAHQTMISEKREKFLKAAQEKFPEISSEEKRKRALVKYAKAKCENFETDRFIHPSQRIKFKVFSEEYDPETNTYSNVEHFLCYNIVELWVYLNKQFVSIDEWREPIYNYKLTKSQKDLLMSKYSSLNSCGDSKKIILRAFSNVNIADFSSEVFLPQHIFTNFLESKYLYNIYRISKAKYLQYDYILVREFHDNERDHVYLPPSLMEFLKLKEGENIYLEECFTLPKVKTVFIKKITESSIPFDSDEIKSELIRIFENSGIVQIGQDIVLEDIGLHFRIVDLYGFKEFEGGLKEDSFDGHRSEEELVKYQRMIKEKAFSGEDVSSYGYTPKRILVGITRDVYVEVVFV